ncbi:MAG: AmmeMemoRadiSam system protein A [Microthrixaceae bacterium]|nr:AmmeMemoRadiSam system protein A [Acidimicrobiales bacterium]MCB9404691.1 AmmeMemoRadiSam system protein A [Microthrixaceae bacterium]
MAPSLSPEPGSAGTPVATETRDSNPQLPPETADALLAIARQSIVDAFDGKPLPSWSPAVPGLHERRGVFVTLHVDGDLNGCIGEVSGDKPLVDEVARLARAAAFDDPRLPALRRRQLPRLTIEVSAMSPLEPIPATSAELLRSHLTPEVHGLMISSGNHRALFLPDVWQQLPKFADFIGRLFAKAGMDPRYWPDHLQAWRFTTQAFTSPPH